MALVAFTTEPTSIKSILENLGLPSQRIPRNRASLMTASGLSARIPLPSPTDC